MQIDNIQSTVAGASKRAEEAEKFMEAVKAELAEAKVVQKYNLQLHKDLQREQQARKKLHNDMEDLKGKIRVYVRIRPFSKSEQQRGCEESVFKDGKMTVLLKGLGGDPNAKKYYDFDQVFGGSMEEGNSQADIFKDTKHLMQSVVDGYNVCIFAYGQTGAGKVSRKSYILYLYYYYIKDLSINYYIIYYYVVIYNDWCSRYWKLFK